MRQRRSLKFARDHGNMCSVDSRAVAVVSFLFHLSPAVKSSFRVSNVQKSSQSFCSHAREENWPLCLYFARMAHAYNLYFQRKSVFSHEDCHPYLVILKPVSSVSSHIPFLYKRLYVNLFSAFGAYASVEFAVTVECSWL